MPLAIEAVHRIDEIFAVEREINGAAPKQRHAVRQERIKPLVVALEGWMRTERARLSRHADPQAWLADVLRRIADHPASKLDELLPWNWKKSQAYAAAA